MIYIQKRFIRYLSEKNACIWYLYKYCNIFSIFVQNMYQNSGMNNIHCFAEFLSGSSRISTWGTVFQYVYKRFISVDMIDINKVSGL